MPVRQQARLIPARAGNITGVLRFLHSRTAHPRSRGEHPVRMRFLRRATGSSPLARGTFRPIRPACPPIRLIPARAGNIPETRRFRGSCPAHPRSRGEHRAAPGALMPAAGSSPLARGTSLRKHPAVIRDRLIPARAGNIWLGFGGTWFFAAHPRSRGEHHRGLPYHAGQRGSSPLARGTFSISL